MTTRADYTPEEWTMLLLAPVQAGIAVLLSSPSGLIGTAKEAFALYSATNKSAAQHYSDNELVQSILSEDRGEAEKQVLQHVTASTTDQRFREQLKPEALKTCSNVATLLAQRSTPQEALGYKRWLMEVINKVAEAGKEEGQQISPAEEMTMQEVSEALGVSFSPAR